MNRPVVVEWSETATELESRYRGERDVERRKRLGALWLMRRGDRVSDAARLVGVGERTVLRWLKWYREAGLEGVLERVPGHGAQGQLHQLTAQQRAELLRRARCGEFRTYDEARAWVGEAFGVEYRPGGIWSAVQRLKEPTKGRRPSAQIVRARRP